jgi:hypothetical protein
MRIVFILLLSIPLNSCTFHKPFVEAGFMKDSLSLQCEDNVDTITTDQEALLPTQPNIATNTVTLRDTVTSELDISEIRLPIPKGYRATLTVYNYTDNFLFLYPPDGGIEISKNGKWQRPPIRKEKLFLSEGWVFVKPHMGKEFWIPLHSDMYVYKPGLYRVKRKFYWKDKDKDSFYIYHEFRVIQ